jgi:hypothetical protein
METRINREIGVTLPLSRQLVRQGVAATREDERSNGGRLAPQTRVRPLSGPAKAPENIPVKFSSNSATRQYAAGLTALATG